jgi:hypothetical protein
MKLNDPDHIHASIGRGDITVTQLLKAIYPELDESEAMRPSSRARSSG